MFKILFSNNGLTAYKPLSSDLQNYIQKIRDFSHPLRND